MYRRSFIENSAPDLYLSPIIGGIMKVKRANRLMSIIDGIWVIHLQKVNTLLMIGIYDKYFHYLSKWWLSGRKWGWPI
jgi:hypothetical protein